MLCLAAISLSAQNRAFEKGIETVPRQVVKPLISGLTLPLNDPSVIEVLAIIKKNVPLLSIKSVAWAKQRALPRATITLHCLVIGVEGQEVWEFTVSERQSGHPRFWAAQQIEQ
jgi:hypothetical protein